MAQQIGNVGPPLSFETQARANADHEEPVMTSFTFSLEQLRAAPPEVRRWVEHEIGAALGALGRLDRDQSQVHNDALAACTPEEALQMFESIKDNFLLSQVFFELAREMPAGRSAPPLHALRPRRFSTSCAAPWIKGNGYRPLSVAMRGPRNTAYLCSSGSGSSRLRIS
jgi:hypothetical protein